MRCICDLLIVARKGSKSIGKTAVRLEIDQGNPQSTHFWKKNGFMIITEDQLLILCKDNAGEIPLPGP